MLTCHFLLSTSLFGQELLGWPSGKGGEPVAPPDRKKPTAVQWCVPYAEPDKFLAKHGSRMRKGCLWTVADLARSSTHLRLEWEEWVSLAATEVDLHNQMASH